MIKDSKKVEKILESFFNNRTVHSQPLLSIKKEIRSTYDGDYPYFELIYDASGYNNGNEMEELIESVTGYTGLKEGRDYWLGVTWQYLEV
jgi:hypothetical protein